MTVSFVGSTSAEATSLTLPAHEAGDTIVIVAARINSVTMPTIPAGWYGSAHQGRGAVSPLLAMGVGWKVAASSAELSGTWTNADLLLCAVLRDDTNYVVAGAVNTSNSGPTTNINYPILNVQGGAGSGNPAMRSASAFVLGAMATNVNNSNAEGAPSGMTNIISLAGVASIEAALHRTTNAVASWASTNFTASTSVAYVSAVVEFFDTGIAKSAGGGMLIHPGMSGGMRG